MDYFHNGGFFRVEGADFDGVFQLDQPEGSLPFLALYGIRKVS